MLWAAAMTGLVLPNSVMDALLLEAQVGCLGGVGMVLVGVCVGRVCVCVCLGCVY